MSEQNSLRDMLEANLNASDAGTLDQVADATPVVDAQPQEAQSQTQSEAGRQRDDQGRFSAKEAEATPPTSVEAAVPPAESVAPVTADASPPPQRPTNWKKEYLPMWDKLATGQTLTPDESKKLAEYSQQREREYANGVSNYRAKAEAATELQSAIEPFMPVLQQHNMKVGDWIKNLGNAHQTLALGTPEQKLQMFANMAQQYGIPLQAVTQAQQGQVDPSTIQFMQQADDMKNRVASVERWREQQEQNYVQAEFARFSDTSKYPHFEQVRDGMAQLLERGMAQDLDSAYAKAVRLDDGAWTAEQERQAQHSNAAAQQASKAEAAARAKAAAVSPKSVTPSGAAKVINAGGLRESLEAGFASLSGARL